jgi:nucleotide-binding universal stress UspA family protein
MAMANAFEWNHEVEQRELDYLTVVAGRLERSSNVSARTKLLCGHAAEAICNAARDHERTLIVMSSHGRTGFGRFWLGSVADAVVRGCEARVLMVRCGADSGGPAPDRFGPVLVPLDGSQIAESILSKAAWLCCATGAPLVIFRAIRPEEVPPVDVLRQEVAVQAAIREEEEKLRAVAERVLTGRQIPIEVVVRVHDSAAAAINDYAAANDVTVVAMTTRGAGLARLLGNVADKVIRNGPPMILLSRSSATPSFSRQGLHE